jgi:hypothetical protein
VLDKSPQPLPLVGETRFHLHEGTKKSFKVNAFFVSSDVTAEDRLARVLRNAMPSANGW